MTKKKLTPTQELKEILEHMAFLHEEIGKRMMELANMMGE